MEIGSKSWNRLIADGANEFGIHLDDEKIEKLSLYAGELILWNRKINLTAITDPFEIGVKHFIDSIVPSLYIHAEASILDIGSGAGFPGIPLAILHPTLSTTLIDTSRKKVSFLKHIVRILKLPNISIYQTRGEDIDGNDQFDCLYNVIISRALFSLEKLVSIALPLLFENGVIIAMKGKSVNENTQLKNVTEILQKWKNESTERNYIYSIKNYTLPIIDAERSIFCFQFKS